MTIIVLTASAAAVFGGIETDEISSYADLIGKTVCTTTNTMSHDWLSSIVPCACNLQLAPSSAQMYEDYWDGRCAALLYDFPLTSEQIRLKGEQSDPPKIVTEHGLSGPVLNDDPYGIMVPQNHPLYEDLKRAMTSVIVNQPKLRLELVDKWFQAEASDPSFIVLGSEGVKVPVSLFWMPPAITLAIIVVAILISKSKKEHLWDYKLKVLHVLVIVVTSPSRPITDVLDTHTNTLVLTTSSMRHGTYRVANRIQVC